MKRYEQLGQDPVKMTDYIAEKLLKAIKGLCDKTGCKFYYNNIEYQAVRCVILEELIENVED